jgi:ribosomal protein L18E
MSVINGKYTEHNSFSERGLFWFFFVNLSLITVILLIFVIVRKRERLLSLISIAKCRISKAAVPPPTDGGAVLVEDNTGEHYSIEEEIMSIDEARADSLITDSLAKDLIRKDGVAIETAGTKKHIINIDTLSESFSSGDTVDVNKLKEMSLIPYDTAYLKVLARGMIDKPLHVYANDFSLTAVKMIALTGGEAVRVVSVKRKGKADEKSKY